MTYPPSPSSSFDNRSSSSILNTIQLLRARWQGTLETHWNVVKLSPDHYASLWQQLESKEKELAEYIRNHARTNYDPETFQFSVPMALPVHEHLLDFIKRDIFEQLSSIQRHGNNPAAGLAEMVYPGGSSKIFFGNGGHRSPDIQFIYPGAKYPSLVIEIAYSQSEKGSLPKLADEYITRSEGNILLVIGVEVVYRGEKMGTISRWCPKFGVDDQGGYLASQQTIVSQAFRNVDGTAVSGTALRIPFRSFTPEDICSQFSPEALDEELVLSFEKLARYLEFAEGEEEIKKTGQARRKPLKAGMRIRMRASTPPEILSVEDESRFAREDSAEARKAEEKNGYWDF